MVALIICLILKAICLGHAEPVNVVIVPPSPNYHPIYSRWHSTECECNECEWRTFKREAQQEYADEFTAYFNAIEYKRASNGVSMIKRPGDKSFRFVKKG